ncbi:MAG: hypothetical protein QOF11_421 [Chloroflexota bacterium]|jgi:hypothetical protein|nr:hypothetical protein [Chloroflexota bacterium]
MPQLLHPSFLRLGRRPAAILLILGALGLLVTGLARPADASDPYVAGSDATRVERLSAAVASATVDRAVAHERLLGLSAVAQRTVDRVLDRRGQRTFDEVTDLDGRGRPVAVLRYGLDGRLIAATRLGWQPGAGRALATRADAVRSADRLARLLGIVPVGTPLADGRGANGWSVRWPRVLDGVPVPGDGLRVQLWPDGSLHGLASAEHPLAARPAAAIAATASQALVTRLLDRWIPAVHRGEVRIVASSLAWVAPNDTFEPVRPDAPAEIRRLAWVVSVRSSGTLAQSLRALEVWIDAGDGSLLGGDVLR